MKRPFLSHAAVLALLPLTQPALACEAVNSSGSWTVVANGHEFRMNLLPTQSDEFNGYFNSDTEARTSITQGRCQADRQRVTFLRNLSGGTRQGYEGFYWVKDGAMHVAGTFWYAVGDTFPDETTPRWGFHMSQDLPPPEVPATCRNGQPTFYYDQNFQGAWRVYGRGTRIPDLTEDGDEFHSLCVPEGFRVIAYEDDDFRAGGEAAGEAVLTVIGPLEVTDLDQFSVSGRTVRNWGDEIDSLEIE